MFSFEGSLIDYGPGLCETYAEVFVGAGKCRNSDSRSLGLGGMTRCYEDIVGDSRRLILLHLILTITVLLHKILDTVQKCLNSIATSKWYATPSHIAIIL